MQVSLITILKFFLMTMGVLAIIYVALLLTPKVGKYIDERTKNYREKHPKPEEDERLYLVKSPFDGNHQLDMDKLYEQEKARREALGEGDTDTKNNDNGDVNKNG